MRTGRLLGVVLLAAVGACGPDLPFPNRGRDAGIAGIAGFAGSGGGGSGGDGRDGGGGWTGDAGGTSGPSLYTWEDVAVRVVEATSATPSGLFFRMTDQTGNSTLSSAAQFPPMMALRFPSDGAFVAAHYYDCTGPNLYRLALYSCQGQYSTDNEATAPGCLAVVFGAQGARGNYVTGAGVSCAIDSTTATASIDLPPPRGAPVASGKFTLQCAGGDRTRLKLEGVFALPVMFSFMPC
jgi:hypothetical protein